MKIDMPDNLEELDTSRKNEIIELVAKEAGPVERAANNKTFIVIRSQQKMENQEIKKDTTLNPVADPVKTEKSDTIVVDNVKEREEFVKALKSLEEKAIKAGLLSDVDTKIEKETEIKKTETSNINIPIESDSKISKTETIKKMFSDLKKELGVTDAIPNPEIAEIRKSLDEVLNQNKELTEIVTKLFQLNNSGTPRAGEKVEKGADDPDAFWNGAI